MAHSRIVPALDPLNLQPQLEFAMDRFLFWTGADLEGKLTAFKGYYNEYRSHSGLNGKTPVEGGHSKSIDFKSYGWKQHCRGLYQTPMAA
jgi:hypothetical protein